MKVKEAVEGMWMEGNYLTLIPMLCQEIKYIGRLVLDGGSNLTGDRGKF
jgi:hypothetical protein